MAHGWYGAKCPCEPTQQQQQHKTYKTTSTSTEPVPSDRILTCSHCDVPRRVSPPGCKPTGMCRPLGATAGSPLRGTPRPGIAVPTGIAMGTNVLNNNNYGESQIVASTSIDLIDLSDCGDHYANFNPCYKSVTPPEEAPPPYPGVGEGHHAASGEVGPRVIQDLAVGGVRRDGGRCGHPDLLPPRSSTAPDVHVLEDLFETELWQPRSPRASWAGPSTSNLREELHIYDEVYVSRTPPPIVEPPPRSSSLQPPKPKRVSSLKPSIEVQTTSSGSRGTQTLQLGAHGSSPTETRCSSPSSRMEALTLQPSLGGSASLPPGAIPGSLEVWVPQIQHKQSASFAGLSSSAEDATRPGSQARSSRLSQSCELLPSASSPVPGSSSPSFRPSSTCSSSSSSSQTQGSGQTQTGGTAPRQGTRRSKRRCPTPPRVLSPSLENFKCELIADI